MLTDNKVTDNFDLHKYCNESECSNSFHRFLLNTKKFFGRIQFVGLGKWAACQ